MGGRGEPTIDTGFLSTLTPLLAFVALTAANAGFVAAEFSLVTVDRAAIEQRASGGDGAARKVSDALRELSFQLSGAQLGITLCSLLTGYLAEPALARLLTGPLAAVTGQLGLSRRFSDQASSVLALTIATLVSMLFGELVPKNAALARPMRVARMTAGPQRVFSNTCALLIHGLNGSANWLVRRFGVQPQEELASARSPEELGLLAVISARAGALPRETAVLMQRTVRFGEKRAAEAMTPRVDVEALLAEVSVADLLVAARETGHSRFPVYQHTLDQVTGVATVKDALAIPPLRRASTPVAAVAREPVFVPESLDLDGVLAALRLAGVDLAIVIDEYGGTDGLVTIEDLVEELVGEIADEHDVLEATTALIPPDLSAPGAVRTACVDGVLRADELAEQTGFRMPEGPYETLAGFLMCRLGHIPVVGERVTEDGWEFTVVEVQRRRIEQVSVSMPERFDG